jgi:hypothetical protein
MVHCENRMHRNLRSNFEPGTALWANRGARAPIGFERGAAGAVIVEKRHDRRAPRRTRAASVGALEGAAGARLGR